MSDVATKMTTVAENQQKVYDAGYDKGVTDGKQAEYDRFWDAYQADERYSGAFCGPSWTDENFTPKRDMQPISAQYMFWSSGITDLVACLKRQGVSIDFSKSNNFNQIFAYSAVTHVGKIDLSGMGSAAMVSMFLGSAIVTIDEIVFKPELTYNSIFRDANNLKNITASGIIANSGLNFQWSTLLSKASITSIINALSTTTSGLSITFSQTAVTNAFGSTMADEWTALIAAKSNWTISLA